jgi:integrase
MKMILPTNERDIAKIGPAPPKQRVIHWDGVVLGLGLRVTDTGHKTYVLVHRIKGGKLVNHAIGPQKGWLLKDAREEARRVLMTLDRGKTPKEERAEALAARGPTFATVAEDYIRYHVPTLKTAKDQREVEARVRRELVGRWGDRPIAEVRNRDVVRMCRELIAAGGDDPEPGSRRQAGGPSAARHARATASHLFRWAIEQDEYGLIGNPVVISAKTAHGRAPRRSRVLREWEVRAIWNASFKVDQPYGPLIRMLMLTGQRLNEIAKAKRTEVDLDAAVLVVPEDRMKGGDGHTVPLVPMAVKLLSSLLRFEGVPHIFSTTRGVKPFSNFSKSKKRFDRLVPEVPHWTQHDLRRTLRTELSRLGVRNEVAEMVIAHKRQGIEAVYDLHRFDDEKRTALEAWERRLMAIVG